MSDFFVIMMNFKSTGVAPTKEIEALLDNATADWLRFSSNQYVVRYSGSAKALSDAVRAVLQPGVDILLLPVELNNRAGWASTLVVDWLKKHVP
jgi:hypothetical protein